MASSETFDVILRLLMDEAALGRIKSGASSVADEFKKVDDATEEVTKEIKRQEKIALSAMKQEASAIRKISAYRAKEIGELKERADWLERGSKAMFTAGIAGITSITLLAKKYIDSTEESNQITQAWAASTEKVNDAQMRIGKIAAEAVLPIYEKLADIAEKGADFIEKNPGAIEAGLKTSIVLAGLGGLGLLAAKGMRLYADFAMIAVGDTQLLAAKIMSDAAKTQLAAAGGGKISGIGGAAAKTAAKTTVVKTAATSAAETTVIKKVATSAALTAGGVFLAVLGGILVGSAIVDTINAEAIAAGKADTAWATFRKGMLLWTGTLVPSALDKLGIISTETRSKLWELQKSFFGLSETSIMASASALFASDASNKMTQSNFDAGNSMNKVASSANSVSSASKGLSGGLVNIGNSISKFIEKILSVFGGSSIPTHDYTGYAYSRTYAMAQDGKRQFVMSGNMTRVAEQMLGGQLNQQAVLSAMSGGSRSSVVWNDQRRFSGEYTKSMRNSQRSDTINLLSEVFKK